MTKNKFIIFLAYSYFKFFHFVRKLIKPTNTRYKTFRTCFELMRKNNAKIIVETGTARDGLKSFKGDGGSTMRFSQFAAENDGILYSVDINKDSLEKAKSTCEPYKKHVNFIHNDSIDFLQKFSRKIDMLYLDSFDFDENNPTLSQKHHLKEIEAAFNKLSETSIVMIDDCNLPHGGKGKLAIEFLLNKGWKIIQQDYQVILMRK
ncbi:MAG: class I SAM-dependent methyltransferase [Chlamydiae bacterium]|nr:class I SAM-dependent methyltransferase [Chlamydiota bacterium]